MRITLVVIFVAALFAAPTPAFSDGQKFRIGAILPLTGPTAEYGEAIVNAISLAQRDFPELFKNVTFHYEDVRYETSAAVSAFQKLTNVEKSSLIFTWGVTFCRALAPLAERRQIPTVGECVDAESSRGKNHFIRFMNSSSQYAELQARFLKARGVRRVGIVLTENGYLEQMFESLRSNLDASIHVEILQRYQFGQMDLRDSIARARHGNFDAIGVFLAVGQIAEFYKELKAHHVNILTFGTNFFESASELKAADGAMNGAFFVNNEIRPEFIGRYQEAFHAESQLAFGAPAYEFALSVARIVTANPGISGQTAALRVKAHDTARRPRDRALQIQRDRGFRRIFRLPTHCEMRSWARNYSGEA